MRRKIWFTALVVLGIAALAAAVVGLRGEVSSLALRDMGAVAVFLMFLLYMILKQRQKDPADREEP